MVERRMMRRWTTSLAALAVAFPYICLLLGVSSTQLVSAQDWSYDDSLANGPSSWANLFNPQNPLVEAYPKCDGSQQSPIDVRGVSTSSSREETVASKATSVSGGFYATLNYALQDLPLRWSGMINMTLEVAHKGKVLRLSPLTGRGATFADPNTDIAYTFQHADFHTPSEHFLAGVVADVELQLVHTAKSANVKYPTLIISIPLRAVSSYSTHADLDHVLQGFSGGNLDAVVVPSPFQGGGVGQYNVSAAQGDAVSVASFFSTSKEYYTYDGSLTYPPCTESVKWYLMAQATRISTSQLEVLRKAVGLPVSEALFSSSSSAVLSGNSRPPHPVGSRSLFYHQGSVTDTQAIASGGSSSSAATCAEDLVCSDSARRGTSTTALVLSVLGAVCCVAALALRLTEEQNPAPKAEER